MFKNADEKATQRVTRLAKARISNACHKNFVILSVATKRVARRKPQQKNPQNLRHALNLWILRFLAKAQYGKEKCHYNKVRCHCGKEFVVMTNPLSF